MTKHLIFTEGQIFVHVYMLNEYLQVGRLRRRISKSLDSSLPLVVDILRIFLLHSEVSPRAWPEQNPVPQAICVCYRVAVFIYFIEDFNGMDWASCFSSCHSSTEIWRDWVPPRNETGKKKKEGNLCSFFRNTLPPLSSSSIGRALTYPPPFASDA